MGQELHSCDTTQIDVKNARSLMRTIIRIPIDNGRAPVGHYSISLSLRPQQSIPSAPPTVITPPTALLTTVARKYYSVSKV